MRFSLNKKSNIDKYTNTLIKRQSDVQKLFANKLMENLTMLSPKRTGKLANSYFLQRDQYCFKIYNNCGYCFYVNNGTRFQPGQHFIQSAYFSTKQLLNQLVQQVQSNN